MGRVGDWRREVRSGEVAVVGDSAETKSFFFSSLQTAIVLDPMMRYLVTGR